MPSADLTAGRDGGMDCQLPGGPAVVTAEDLSAGARKCSSYRRICRPVFEPVVRVFVLSANESPSEVLPQIRAVKDPREQSRAE
jgi:hypothetical protein